MSPAATEETNGTVVPAPSKPNIGVYTNPEHKLWIAESEPTLEQVKKGSTLNEGEVTVGVRSTGICGYVTAVLRATHHLSLIGQSSK
jgi:L-iditol 2-dehydrogenase